MPEVEFPADLRLDQAKACQVAIWWPIPLHDRLKKLVRRANDAGVRTSQKELLAAAVLALDPAADELDEWIRRYRKATVRDALLEDSEPSVPNVIQFDVKSSPEHRGTP